MNRYRPIPLSGPNDPRLLYVKGLLTDDELVAQAGICEAVRVFTRMEFGVPLQINTESN